MPPDPVERKLAAILNADVVGYSRLMAEDEAETVRRLGAYRTEVMNLVGEHRGRVVDFTGDNFLAEFPTATDAVEAAAEIQRVLKARNAAVPAGRAMEFRIGVHLGEVRVEGERLYGDGVNIAARLEGLAEPGGICISDDVLHQVQRKLELDFEDLGQQSVKNIPDPVHAYHLRERAAVALARPRRTSSRIVIASGAAVISIALVAGIYWLTRTDAATGPPLTAIAVLPFDDMSPAGDQEYFADGIAEEIINALSRVEELRVAARTSAFAFKGKNEDIRAIGEQLGVGAVVEGSVRKAGDRLRITAQLIRVADGFHIWSDSYDRNLDDVFAIQEEIARATVDALKVRLATTQPLVKRSTSDFRAYELYLTGRHFSNQRTEDGLRQSIGHFQRALQADPNYALAYVGLADSYLLLWDYRYEPREQALLKAEAAMSQALAIDENSGEARTSLARLREFQWRWDEAETEYRQALQLNSGYATAHHWYAMFLLRDGRTDEALVEIERALELDPLSPVINRNAGRTYNVAGNYTRAIERLKKTLELNPNDPAGRRGLVIASLAQGRAPEVFEGFPGQGSRPEDEAELRAAYQEGGSRAFWRRSLELRIAETQKPCTDNPRWAASTLARLQEPELMFECLEQAVDQKLILFLAGPTFAEYRDDPRFAALLQRMNLAD